MKRVCHCGRCDECTVRKIRVSRHGKAASREAIADALANGERPPANSFEEWAARRRREW